MLTNFQNFSPSDSAEIV